MNLTLFHNQVNGNTGLAVKNRKLLAAVEQKRAMLVVPEVQSKLNPIEMSIAEAGVKTPIRVLDQSEMEKDIITQAKFICRDVGIQHWNDAEKMKYEVIRFTGILRSYYSEMSIDDVVSAFELASVGELDEYLPKDKEGNPDKNHYQKFSVEYYTKILNAYRKRRSNVWGKIRLALPAPEMVISEEERKRNHQGIINDIYDAYINYQKGVSPNFPISVHINELMIQGHIKELPKPKKTDYERAFRSMLTDPNIPRDEKKKIKSEYAQKGMPLYIQTEAQRSVNNKIIGKLFEFWISEGFDILPK